MNATNATQLPTYSRTHLPDCLVPPATVFAGRRHTLFIEEEVAKMHIHPWSKETDWTEDTYVHQEAGGWGWRVGVVGARLLHGCRPHIHHLAHATDGWMDGRMDTKIRKTVLSSAGQQAEM